MPALNGNDDIFRWWLTANGVYSASSAYRAFFYGTEDADFAKHLWKNIAPLKEKLFVWFALHNRYWTADHLKRRGLDRPDACALCDQVPETIDRLLVQCPFSREVWFKFLRSRHAAALTPDAQVTVRDWWCSLPARATQVWINAKLLAALAIAGMRRIRLERNARVFEADLAIEEVNLWLLARQRAGRGE